MNISELQLETLPFGNVDADDELHSYQELQAEESWKQFQNLPFHRCPPDMCPCPQCEELNDKDI